MKTNDLLKLRKLLSVLQHELEDYDKEKGRVIGKAKDLVDLLLKEEDASK